MLCVMKTPTTFSYDEIRQWPAAVDLVKAALVFGIGRTVAYEMAKAGTFPARVVRVGTGHGRYVVSTQSILAVLGATDAKEPACES